MSAGPEDLIIAGILGQHGTASERLAALEHSEAPELTYGLRPWADEEAEIATVASYLQAKRRDGGRQLAAMAGHAAQPLEGDPSIDRLAAPRQS